MNKNIEHILHRDQLEAVLAFHNLSKEIFEKKLLKVIYLNKKGNGSHTNNSLDLFLLFSTLSKEDTKELAHLAEDLSENNPIQISPIAMDEKTFKEAQSKQQQLIKDIDEFGVEIT